jgi:nitrogen fixation/metabolism regulation signal transduction histidine kinase
MSEHAFRPLPERRPNTRTAMPNSPEQTGSYKRRVRNYLLDSRFQLKYTGFLVIVAIVISGVMGSVLYSTTRAMVDESAKVVEESRKVAEESKKVSEVSRMNIRDLASDSPELLSEFNKEADAYDRMMVDQQKAIADQQAALIRNQRVVIASLVAGLALMVVLIGLLGIYFTHKVAGPVFKMKRLLRQVGEGNLRVEARLRKGDELQDFFDAFTQMIAGLRKFEKAQLDELESAMSALARGEKDDAVASVGRVAEAMKHAIDR